MSEIPSKYIQKSSLDAGTKDAWARLVSQRWPHNALKGAMSAWGLTEGQARGLVYGQATQPTIDAVLKAAGRIGAFRLGLEVLTIQTGVELEQFIEHQAQEATRERRTWEAEEARLETLATRIAERGRVDRREA